MTDTSTRTSGVTVKFEQMHTVEAGVVTFGVVHREFTLDSMKPYLGSPGVQEIVDRIKNEGFFDQGVSIYVFETGTKRDYLRFDCFEVEPHYHYHHLHSLLDGGADIDLQYLKLHGHADAVSMNGFWHQVPFDSASNGDIRDWALDRLRTRLPEMLTEAGEGDFAASLDMAAVGRGVDEIEPLVYADVDRT